MVDHRMADVVAPVAEDRLTSLLREQFGHDEFREGQKEIMSAVLGGRDALAIMPTGSGKSLIYQLPAQLLERVGAFFEGNGVVVAL